LPGDFQAAAIFANKKLFGKPAPPAKKPECIQKGTEANPVEGLSPWQAWGRTVQSCLIRENETRSSPTIINSSVVLSECCRDRNSAFPVLAELKLDNDHGTIGEKGEIPCY
jgi:hypothetical protein